MWILNSNSKFQFHRDYGHVKRRHKRKLTIFGNTKQVIQDYDTVFDNSIPFRKNDLLRITYFRLGIPGVPQGPHSRAALSSCHWQVTAFVPWHRGSWCLGAAARVTGAAADEYNLNVVDCHASVTVVPSQSVGIWGLPPVAGSNRER